MKPNRYMDGALLCAGVSKKHGLCGQYAKPGSRYCYWHDKKNSSWDEVGPELLDTLGNVLDAIGALSKPHELISYGVVNTMEECNEILALVAKAQEIKK